MFSRTNQLLVRREPPRLATISGDRLAKGVVVRRDGNYVLAVLPVSHHIRPSELSDQLGTGTEKEIAQLFRDCVPGAVPAIGECYGVETVVDGSIEEQPEIYLEGGDHEVLVHMNKDEFCKPIAGALHGRFSAHD